MAPNKSMILMPRAYHNFVRQVITSGDHVSPRGLETIEIVNGSFTLRDPLDRVVTDRGRKMNIAFGIAEWYAIMFGIDDINFFKRFISDYDKFSSDGKTLDGAYGTRIQYNQMIAGVVHARNQIDGVIGELKLDLHSRRAVMSIYTAEDLYGHGGINTPCTLTIQFLVREERLNMIVNMRSSDVVRGVTYDMFVFTLIQEYIARQLGLDLGEYYHNAGSLHFYMSDMEMINNLTEKRWPGKMRQMPVLTNEEMKRLQDLISSSLDDSSFFTKIASWPNTKSSAYLKDMAYTMKAFVDRKRAPTSAATAFACINDKTIKYVLRPWLEDTKVITRRSKKETSGE